MTAQALRGCEVELVAGEASLARLALFRNNAAIGELRWIHLSRKGQVMPSAMKRKWNEHWVWPATLSTAVGLALTASVLAQTHPAQPHLTPGGEQSQRSQQSLQDSLTSLQELQHELENHPDAQQQQLAKSRAEQVLASLERDIQRIGQSARHASLARAQQSIDEAQSLLEQTSPDLRELIAVLGRVERDVKAARLTLATPEKKP
jgi:molecular chaperone DnaK (HSP70)